jgi:hypothetical protein
VSKLLEQNLCVTVTLPSHTEIKLHRQFVQVQLLQNFGVHDCFLLLLDMKAFALFLIGFCEGKFDVDWQITLL